VNDSQEGLTPTSSHINNGGSSAINFGMEEKTAKVNAFSLIQP
jgi:hypothetical protein